MTLVLAESFDYLNVYADKYAGSGTVQSGTVRTGSQAAQLASTAQSLTLDFGGNLATVYIGFAIRFSAYPVSTLLRIYDAASIQTTIIIGPNGLLQVYQGTTFLTAGNTYLSPDTWYYIEVKATTNNSISANDYQVKVNGVVDIDLPATTDTQVTANAYATKAVLYGNTPGNIFLDDIYVCNTSGSVNNTFLGDCVADTLYADGNGNSSDWVGSDVDYTDNYLHVDDAQADDDSSYVEADTVDYIDLYTFDALGATPNTIHGVIVDIYAKKDDSGAKTGKHICRSGSTNYEGDNWSPTESTYEYHTEIWETDPDTSSAWDATGVNAVELGVKVQA